MIKKTWYSNLKSISLSINTISRQIFNPKTHNNYRCKSCNVPLILESVDFVGVLLYPAPMYLGTIACPNGHKRYVLLYRNVGDKIALAYRKSLTRHDFKKVRGEDYYILNPETHNLSYLFFSANMPTLETIIPSNMDIYPSIFHQYGFKNPEEVIESYRKYMKTLSELPKFITKKRKSRRKRRSRR